ncbi:MAG: hypothetical protein U0R71_06620 [Solirubrobacterales bacterium]
MYVRIARFDGGERSWDGFADQIRESIRDGARGTPLEGAIDSVQRVMLLADRESNRGANLIVCETEEGLRRVDAALNEMTPEPGRGSRTSVEMFEVLLDEQPPS